MAGKRGTPQEQLPSNPEPSRLAEKLLVAVLLLALMLARFRHFGNPIEDPHSWRQADTECYAQQLARHGMDLLHPRVCWLGTYGIAALECPLYEWLVALFYRISGEHLQLARAVALAGWSIGCIYLFLIVRRFGSTAWALWSLALFAAAPLGIYFSRAVLTDVSTISMALAMMYYYLCALDQESRARRRLQAAAGTAFGVVAFLTKAPYAALLYLPILVHGMRSRRAHLVSLLPWLSLPWIPFIAWSLYADSLNRLAPELSFNPGMNNLFDLGWWYFGNVQERLVPGNWLLLAWRLLWECSTPIGIVMLIAGMVLYIKRYGTGLFMWWLIAVMIYLLVFFNLNGAHDYYQLPFLAPIAIMGGYCVTWLVAKKRIWSVVGLAAVVASVLFGIKLAEDDYFKRDMLRELAAKFVNERTRQDDVVVVVMTDTHPGDPRMLYRSDRVGYNVHLRYATPQVIDRFRQRDATVLVILTHVGEVEPGWVRTAYRLERRDLDQGGVRLGSVALARL